MAGPAWKFSIILLILHILFTILIGVFGRYGESALPQLNNSTSVKYDFMGIYTSFQDVQGMIFLGFGLLMTFLRRYSFSSVGLNMMIAVLGIEWATVVNGLFHLDDKNTFTIDANAMIAAELTTATVLISFGAVLGKTSPTQLLLLTLIETPLMVANEYIGRYILKAVDVGDSIFVHAFGAYFGLSVARAICKKSMTKSEKEGSIYHSDIFSIIGTLVLWMFWPSFNGGTAVEDSQHRAFVNTFYSLLASAIMTFLVSRLVSEDGKFDMVHVQNATLAGGVAVGASADFVLNPYVAIIIGTIAGTVSTVGFTYLTPFLNKRLFHDTCGVNNLHGMPAILAVIFSAIFAAVASPDNYGKSLGKVFPARDEGRSAGAQAGMQLAALGVTLAIAIISGLLTGLLLRLNVWDNLTKSEYFNDKATWAVPASETYTIVQETKSQEADGEERIVDSSI